jgi:hypothetical protein
MSTCDRGQPCSTGTSAIRPHSAHEPSQTRTRTGLADAGLADEEHGAAAAGSGRRQGGPQQAGFLVPPDQDRAQYLRHSIRIGPTATAGLGSTAGASPGARPGGGERRGQPPLTCWTPEIVPCAVCRAELTDEVPVIAAWIAVQMACDTFG